MNDETYKMRRFDMYPDDWLTGTMDLTPEEEAVYLRICLSIYSKGCPIPDNDRWLAGSCRVSTRKWRTLRQALIDKGKITASDGLIYQERCEKEIEKAAKRARVQAESGAKGGRKRAENALKTSRKRDENIWETAEQDMEPNKNNGAGRRGAQASLKPARALPSPSPSPSPTSKKNYAFAGKVIKLTQNDLTTWRNSYSAIPDIRASLQSRDDWLATQPEEVQLKWFVSTSAVMKREHERALVENGHLEESQRGSGVIY